MLLLGDCNDHLNEIKDNSIDLLVTDPPYGIEFMGKDWDKALVPTETWKECYRILKQGKLAFVMCSPRQDVLARMIINLQDAGFRTNYTSIYWTFASGFPKAANVSKLIDKREGIKGEVIGKGKSQCAKRLSQQHRMVEESSEYYRPFTKGIPNQVNEYDITKPATEEAKKMEGAYVGFQPKPAVEVILVVSKGKTISWLADCRIPYQSEDDKEHGKVGFDDDDKIKGNMTSHHWSTDSHAWSTTNNINEKGRFPANLLVSDDILNDGSVHKSGKFTSDHKARNVRSIYGDYKGDVEYNYTGDSGSYSRYFSLDQWAEKTLPFLIVPKASKSERGSFNSHPTVKALKLMSYLITMGSREGDLVLDPFCGSGTVCIAADQLHRKWIGIEKNPEYAEIIKKRLMVPLSQLKLSIY